SQEDPPKVGDSTYADATLRPAIDISDASNSRLLASVLENSGLSNVTAPYDSRKIRRTSAPLSSSSCTLSPGLEPSDGPSRLGPIIPARYGSCRANDAVTGSANGT